MNRRLFALIAILTLSCSVISNLMPSGEENPISSSTRIPLTPTFTPTPSPLGCSPIQVTFYAEDGTELAGKYFPASDPNAPIFILMHDVHGDQRDWTDLGLAQWLQNRCLEASTPSQFPSMPEGQSFGVFTFDFRGFGASKGARGQWNPKGWKLDADAAMEVVAALPVDQSVLANFNSPPVPVPNAQGGSLMPVFQPPSSNAAAIPIPGVVNLLVLNQFNFVGSAKIVPTMSSGWIDVEPMNPSDPQNAAAIEIPGADGISISPIFISELGRENSILLDVPDLEDVKILPLDPLDPLSGTAIDIPGPRNDSVLPVYIPGIGRTSATPIEIPGKGTVTVLPLDPSDPVSATPIEIPGKGRVNILPIFISGIDPVSATPIEIPGKKKVSVLPVPLPGPSENKEFVSVTLSGPGGEVDVQFPVPTSNQVSGIPVAIPGSSADSIVPVFIPGIGRVGATPIEIPGKGTVSVLPLDPTDPLSATPIEIPGRGVSFVPIYLPGIGKVSATPIEIPGKGLVSILPIDPIDPVSATPIEIPGKGVSFVPAFIPGIDPVSATPIEIPGKKRFFLLAMAPLVDNDSRILPDTIHPVRIVGIGSSIGADAVINACNENCIGALSLSPGGWLGADYSESVTSTKNEDMLVWCAASEGDQKAASTCEGASGDKYQDTYFPGSAHGMALLEDETSQVSPLGQLIFDFVNQLP